MDKASRAIRRQANYKIRTKECSYHGYDPKYIDFVSHIYTCIHYFITYYMSSIFPIYVFTFLNISVLWVLTGVLPYIFLHFYLSILRSGAKLRSLGSGGSADLNVMVSELKDMRESAKGFMNAQNSGNVDFFGIKQLLILRKLL